MAASRTFLLGRVVGKCAHIDVCASFDERETAFFARRLPRSVGGSQLVWADLLCRRSGPRTPFLRRLNNESNSADQIAAPTFGYLIIARGLFSYSGP